MTANTYRQARIRLSSITSWNRNVSSFPLILIRTSSSHTIEFQFVKPQIIIRHNRSFVSLKHFKLVNSKQEKPKFTNQIIPLSMELYYIVIDI